MKATTDQELEIVEVHQEPQNPGIPQSGLNSSIRVVGAMDQTKVANPLEDRQNQKRCYNIQNLQFHDEANEMRGVSEPLQFYEDFSPNDVQEDCNKATTDQYLEIVKVHQESQNPGIPQTGLNSSISIVGAMDQTKVLNPLEEYQSQQICYNVQNLQFHDETNEMGTVKPRISGR